MSMRLLPRIATELKINVTELERKAAVALLEKMLRSVSAQINSILARYGVKSLEELDRKVREGELRESDVFYDLTRLDYLEDLRERIVRLLRELS